MPEAEIKEFVKKYNVEFDMFSKINVNGNDAHPIYKFLKAKQSGTFGDFIKWNFSKFLVNKEGIPLKRYKVYIYRVFKNILFKIIHIFLYYLSLKICAYYRAKGHRKGHYTAARRF